MVGDAVVVSRVRVIEDRWTDPSVRKLRTRMIVSPKDSLVMVMVVMMMMRWIFLLVDGREMQPVHVQGFGSRPARSVMVIVLMLMLK